jgi:hypothetical protein
MDKKLRTTLILSWLIAVFYLFPAPLVSIIRNAVSYITMPGFREGNWPISLVPLLTLVVGLLFAACLIYLKRGSYRARLIWLGFLAYFVYSSIPVLPALNPQVIVVFLLSLFCLAVGLRPLTSEEIRTPEIGRGLRGISEGFLWLSVLLICLGWSLVVARVLVATHYSPAIVMNGIVSLVVVVPLFIYLALSLHKRNESAPAMVAVVVLAAGLSGFETDHYLPVIANLAYPYDAPLLSTTPATRHIGIPFNPTLIITYIAYHVISLVLAGILLSRFKKRLPAEH